LYVANRVIKYIDRESNVTVFKPGDVIPGFEDWNIHSRRAHLSLEWVLPSEKSIEAASETVRMEEGPEAAQKSDSLACGACGKRFQSTRAVGVHFSKKHR
jgi:hypothetical protein